MRARDVKTVSKMVTPATENGRERLLRWVGAHYDRVVAGGNIPLVVQVGPPREHRSDEMRNTLHMWFGEIACETGNAIDDVKETLVQMFGGVRVVRVNGLEVCRRVSTEDLDRYDYLDLMSQVEAWARGEGFDITDPDPAMRASWRKLADDERQRLVDSGQLPAATGASDGRDRGAGPDHPSGPDAAARANA